MADDQPIPEDPDEGVVEALVEAGMIALPVDEDAPRELAAIR